MPLKTDYVCLSKNKCLSLICLHPITSGSCGGKYRLKKMNNAKKCGKIVQKRKKIILSPRTNQIKMLKKKVYQYNKREA